MKKINVGVFTFDFYPIFGGQGRHIFEIYKQNLDKNEINMLIFSPNINNLKNHINIFPESKTSKLKNLEFSIRLQYKIDEIIKNYNLNIAHFHGGPGGIFLLKKLNIPVVYTSHHTYWQQSHYIKSEWWKYLFYIFEKKSYKYAQKIICVSKDTENIILQHYDIDKNVTEYIPNGINNKLFPPNNKKGKSKNLLYVGRIDKRKGVDFLIKTMSLVNKIDANISLYVVGIGKDKNKLENYSKKNNLNVKFLGLLSDKELNILYKNITIQIVPSIFEGFGISILEGMAKNTLIIATNVDGIKGIIKNRHSGILVNYGDNVALANSIIQLLKNYSLQNKLVSNASIELKKYDWNDIYIKTIYTYNRLTQN